MEHNWSIILVLLILLSLNIVNRAHALTIEQHDGVFGTTVNFTMDVQTEHVLIYPTSSSVNPYTVSAWATNASVQAPMMVVVRQEKEVLSWQIPFLVEATSKRGRKLQFLHTSRTLCHNDIYTINKWKYRSKVAPKVHQDIVLTLSTSSKALTTIFIKVEEEKNFYVKNDMPYSVTVSPSQTRYFYYKFPSNKTDSVILHVTSDDDVCLTVSIQETHCPVFDLDEDITYKGKYQTINRKGGMSIRRKDYPEGFFVVFVAKADNYQCSQEHSILPIPRGTRWVFDNRTSVVDFTISTALSGKGYGVAAVITLAAIAGFFVFAIALVVAFNTWGSISKIRKGQIDPRDVPDRNSGEEPPDLEETVQLSKVQRRRILNESELTVNELSLAPKTSRRRSYNYLWHILSIAIFYSIPVVQLVITYQRVVNRTGDQDLCYFNFMCANPAWGLSDFNHIYSNIGYIFTGILFLAVILYRHAILPFTYTGIPVQYGVFYAMGIALIIEGLLSACYHICPTQSNYQFDTSFMYVMAVLCMIKLYQNRHPDINATAYATFTVLGVAIFLAMIGILNGSLTVWIIFVVVYTGLCVYISFKIYFVSFVLDGFIEFKKAFTRLGFQKETLAPIKRGRFVLLLIANVLNFAMLITGLVLYDTGATDFGTFLLGLLMANSVVYAMFYTLMKLMHKERICIEAITYGLLAVASWAAACVFFLDPATLWTVTPAESRQWNQECILLDFYDKHDVWHLLSAPALYFTFMFLLSLDDDVIEKKRSELTVF